MLSIKWLDSLMTINAPQWDALFSACCDNPFCSHAFLLALEQGGSVDTAGSNHNSGWYSQHLTLWQGNTLVAAVPGYIKHHSYGEYLFDWQIADAYRQYQLPYYPKWVAAIPFTPVTGTRLGVLTPDLYQAALSLVCAELKDAVNCRRFHSIQWLYTSNAVQNDLTAAGFLPRHDVQFLWQNHSYQCFDDYLSQLNARKRKQIRHERSACAGFELKTLHGADLTPEHWQAIIACYQATYLKRSGHHGYISEHSFMQLAATMAASIVVFAAVTEAQNIVAMALCFKSKHTLYGRYWGALIDADCLHFELCYYQGIAYCIEQQLSYFDAGAQGEHKLKRGFAPVTRYGSYLFADTPLTSAIAAYFQQEQRHLREYNEQAVKTLPYKKLNSGY